MVKSNYIIQLTKGMAKSKNNNKLIKGMVKPKNNNKLTKEMAKSKVSLKLLIDTRAKRVLFAEAGKDCVDFLFHILSLPVATIVRLLQAQGMEGSLPNLYQSLEDLNATYIQPGKNKDTFLKPVAPVSGSSVPLLAFNDAQKSYKCGSCSAPFSEDEEGDECPSCGEELSVNVTAEDNGGLVKGVVTYMVMDDLVVRPMSTISSIALLNKFNVKEVGALEEKVVTLRMNEALKLVKASLQSKNVLTDVFC